jgi:hypothetical protein
MATMISEVYDAFKDAGASEEKARRAAEVLASYEKEFADIRGMLRLHSWMLATVIAMLTATLFKLFS